LQRRDLDFEEKDKKILEKVFELTSQYRKD